MPCGHFEAYALAYLLKTVDDERFAAAIDRARKLLDATSEDSNGRAYFANAWTGLREVRTRFTARTGARIQIVLAEEVDWISAAGDYRELHVSWAFSSLARNGESNGAEARPNYLRIHRSRIVRIKGILELRGIDNREFIVKLSDGSGPRSSRTYADRLECWLSSGKLTRRTSV